jgi:hypothetical protein
MSSDILQMDEFTLMEFNNCNSHKHLLMKPLRGLDGIYDIAYYN